MALVGCASGGPAPVAEVPPAPPPPPPDYSDVYAELAAIESTFREGLELLIGGQPSAGRTTMEAASQRLAFGLAACSSAPGCEVARFDAALARLVELQSVALEDQVARASSLEAAAAAATEVVEEEPGTTGFDVDLPEIARTESLLLGTDLREIISLNGPVKAAIDDWLTWMRPNLMDAHENYLFLRSQMAPVFEEAGLPEALLFAMVATESGGKVHAYSRAGAAGPLQFMRYTGRIYGLVEVGGFDMRLDPAASARAAVAYLNERFKELNDSLEKALAAYNGGEGRMRDLQRRHQGSSFWDSRVYYSLPRETREYVPRILAAAWLYLHPDDYNLQFRARDAETTALALRQETSLAELSVCLGQEGEQENGWFRILRNLNPRLEPGDRVAAGGEIVLPASLLPAYEEHCVEGEILARARELHQANYPPEPELDYYTVRAGDTLGRIATRYGCSSPREIGALNDVRPPRYMIRAGQRLKIPKC